MLLKKLFSRFLFVLFFLIFSCCIAFLLFKSIYLAPSVIIPYSLHPYDICALYPKIWLKIKLLFIIFYLLSTLICSNCIYSFINSKISNKTKPNSPYITKIPNDSINLFVGKDIYNHFIVLPEKSLFQNILITGTIGSGKTSSCMYPFTKQLINYSYHNNTKIGMLILDVKGNYYKEVVRFANFSNRLEDLFVLELGGIIKYNPLHKPDLKPSVLANRLKVILSLFSPNSTESYWIDKAEAVLTEAIKFCRLYNDGYVTFLELHKLITLPEYWLNKLKQIKLLFTSGKLSKQDCYDAYTSIDFFENEFFSLDIRTLSILKSEITRITNCFVSDYDVLKTFCPKKDELNFFGFKDLLKSGKILVLNMNISYYQNLSKIIATYLKLDFQTEVLNQLSSNSISTSAFISDEFHEYCTSTDAAFFAQSREAKCINIVATQSYSSLLNTLHDEYAMKVIIQNLINKFWFRTDDSYTIEDIQKQIGKEDKIKFSKSISETASKTNFSYILNSFHSKDSNLSESMNQFVQTDYIYDSHFFTQDLENFSCLSFLSDGNKILKPIKLKLFPYFQNHF